MLTWFHLPLQADSLYENHCYRVYQYLTSSCTCKWGSMQVQACRCIIICQLCTDVENLQTEVHDISNQYTIYDAYMSCDLSGDPVSIDLDRPREWNEAIRLHFYNHENELLLHGEDLNKYILP